MDTLQHIALLIGAIFAYAWFVQHNDARRDKLKAEGRNDGEIERLLSEWE